MRHFPCRKPPRHCAVPLGSQRAIAPTPFRKLPRNCAMAAAAAQAAQPAGVVEYGEPEEQKWRAIQPAAWTGSAAQQFWDYCNCVPFIIRKRCETEAGTWDVFKCWLCNVEVTDSHLRSPKHARRLGGLSAWMLPYLPPDAALLQTFGSWDCPWPGHPRPTGGAGAAPGAPSGGASAAGTAVSAVSSAPLSRASHCRARQT